MLLWFWSLFIFVLCATPGDYIPSSDWMELLSLDKLVHAFLFFILTVLFFVFGIREKRKQVYFLAYVLICVLYGAALEWMQANLFRNRSADWKDIIANTMGCCLALFIISSLRKAFSQQEITSAYK